METSVDGNTAALDDHHLLLHQQNVATPPIIIPVRFSFWTAYRASLRLLAYSPLHLLISAIFPFAGLLLLSLWLVLGHRVAAVDWLALILAFAFTPVSSALSLYLARRRSPLLQGPFLYTFDDVGMHLMGQGFMLNVGWASFVRVEESGAFMFFFTAPARAQVIPMADIVAVGVLAPLRQLVRRHVAVGE